MSKSWLESQCYLLQFSVIGVFVQKCITQPITSWPINAKWFLALNVYYTWLECLLFFLLRVIFIYIEWEIGFWSVWSWCHRLVFPSPSRRTQIGDKKSWLKSYKATEEEGGKATDYLWQRNRDGEGYCTGIISLWADVLLSIGFDSWVRVYLERHSWLIMSNAVNILVTD